MVDVRILKMGSDLIMPSYAHPGDAGIDLRSNEELVLAAGERKTVKTGIKMAIPMGYVGLVWDKSGYASKNGLHVLAGVIDSGYRGEICVVLKNLGSDNFPIQKNMKIAQILIQPIAHANLIEAKNLDETVRNEGGFGSSGKI
ncbi:MAG: dUTP diphosphatase [archaeon]